MAVNAEKVKEALVVFSRRLEDLIDENQALKAKLAGLEAAFKGGKKPKRARAPRATDAAREAMAVTPPRAAGRKALGSNPFDDEKVAS